MTIKYHQSSRTFHLYNDHISYIMKVLPNGYLGNLHIGKKIMDTSNYDHLLELEYRPISSYPIKGNLLFSLEHVKLEYPTYGTSDFRHPAIEVKQQNGSKISSFVYSSHKIEPGKPTLTNLPATYVEKNDEAETLIICLYDNVTNVEVQLTYTIFNAHPVISRSSCIVNHGQSDVYLTEAMSMSVDLPDYDYKWLQLSGAWGRERHIKTRTLEQGIQSIESTRGHSSHQHNPFVALLRPDATEHSGDVIGISLVYSGNFLISGEVDPHHQLRMKAGINPFGFEWKLSPGDRFITPEALIAFSSDGINGMSQVFHQLFNTRLIRGKWRNQDRPILLNNWEATYFDFDEEKVLSIAKKAKEQGIELFVLDDGWFGNRIDDLRGLGDWSPNLEKLPNGIKGLSEKIVDLGMQFGLWFEPEMINEDSELYYRHPDYPLKTPDRSSTEGRNQLVLDFSRADVVNHIFNQMKKVLEDSHVSYIKWDMNRSITEAYSQMLAADQQGEVFHRYILGVYTLYEKLNVQFPDILFESCASGGGRFDPGMLYYAPQTWTSDDTDAIERLKIQYGTSLVYPLSSMGSHVSIVPNEQVFRVTPLKTRANVAHFGTFGYELDFNDMLEDDLVMVRKQIAFHKKYRSLIRTGTFYRLRSPFDSNEVAWMVVSVDKHTALVGCYKILNGSNLPYNRLRLKGLLNSKSYHVSNRDITVSGDQLMHAGLVISDDSSGQIIDSNRRHSHDFDSTIYELHVVNF